MLLGWVGPDGLRILVPTPIRQPMFARPGRGWMRGREGRRGAPDEEAPILPARAFVLWNARPGQSALPMWRLASNNNVFPWVFQKASAAF